MLYFDHAASTPPFEEVIDAVTEAMRHCYGNPSSLHGAGAEAEGMLKQAAETVAASFMVEPEEIVFTSGGTESNNLAIFGAVDAFSNRGNHLVVSRIEHASVYECYKRLEKLGCQVTYLDADHSGAVSFDSISSAIRDDTILVSLMHVNNETGRIQPIEQVGSLLSERPRTLFHVDASQSAGKLPLQPKSANIDLMTLSAHKMGGPKGVGALYKRKGLRISPHLYGGGQQGGLRSGTENVPLIVGMAQAVRIGKNRLSEQIGHLYMLRELLCSRLSDAGQLRLSGTKEQIGMAPHIVHFRLPGIRSEVFIHAMEERGFYVSSQSACSSGEKKPSRILQAMGLSDREAMSGIRISMSHEHTRQDIELLADALIKTAKQLSLWME